MARRATRDVHPLDIALAEHQAAAAEYESLLAALDEVGMHSGPGRVLVEYHFLLGDRIAVAGCRARIARRFCRVAAFHDHRALASLSASDANFPRRNGTGMQALPSRHAAGSSG